MLFRSGAGTLSFDAIDSCGVWPTLAGGGPSAWPGGTVPVSAAAPLPTSPSAPPVPSGSPPPGPGAACARFPTHAAAQAYLRQDPSDPLLLDTSRNGIACEGADGAGFVNPPLDHIPVPRS